jgi:hypothetical protein
MWAYKLFAYNETDPIRDEDAIMHIGNLNFLYLQGYTYDQT